MVEQKSIYNLFKYIFDIDIKKFQENLFWTFFNFFPIVGILITSKLFNIILFPLSVINLYFLFVVGVAGSVWILFHKLDGYFFIGNFVMLGGAVFGDILVVGAGFKIIIFIAIIQLICYFRDYFNDKKEKKKILIKRKPKSKLKKK